jgi:hypothetical protein
LGAYRYTYVLKYKVISVHRQDPEGKYPLKAGDEIFVGHYKPWLPRSQIKDADWGDSPLGGKLDQFVVGEVHRLALDYELQNLAPSGALDYSFPPATESSPCGRTGRHTDTELSCAARFANRM